MRRKSACRGGYHVGARLVSSNGRFARRLHPVRLNYRLKLKRVAAVKQTTVFLPNISRVKQPVRKSANLPSRVPSIGCGYSQSRLAYRSGSRRMKGVIRVHSANLIVVDSAAESGEVG